MSERTALRYVLIALPIGLALIGWVVYHRSRDVAAAHVENCGSESTRTPSVLPPDARTSGPEQVLDAAQSDSKSSRELAPDLPAETEATVELSGAVVAFDPSGTEHASEDGYFQLREGEHEHRVDVKQGHWTTRIRNENQPLGIPRVELAGRTAISRSTGMIQLRVPSSHVLDLRVLWPSSAVLHVKAAESGSELEHVELVRQPRFARWSPGGPGNYGRGDVVLADATSPIAMDLDHVEKEPVPAGRSVYYVRSPGRAWAPASIDFLGSKEETVLLQPATDVEVVLAGIHPPKGAWLRARKGERASNTPEVELPIQDRTRIRLESLCAGVHTISVEPEVWNGGIGTAWAETEVELAAGKPTTITLELRERPVPAKVPLSGVVMVPQEWGISKFQLGENLIRPDGGIDRSASLRSEQMQRLPDVAGGWAFSFAAVRPGLVGLSVYPPGWNVTVQVGEEGLKDARIELPQPAHIVLRIVDGDTGEIAPVQSITWTISRPQDAQSQWAKSNPTPGRFEFVAPSGKLIVSSHDDRYEGSSKPIEVKPGQNEITAEIAKSCGFCLRVVDGSATKRIDEGCVSAARLGGMGTWTRVDDQFTVKRFIVTAPGSYRVVISDIEGYLPVPHRDIQVEAGRFVDVGIELKRKR